MRPDRLEILSAIAQRGSIRKAAPVLGVDERTVRRWLRADNPLPEGDQRLLVIDIETMANLAWVWGVWEQNVNPAQIVKHKRTISFAAKWVGEKRTYFFSEFHDGRETMVRAAWNMLNEADAVIGYNSKRFDVKHMNTEFKLCRLGPPSHFQQIDLLTIARREFAFGHNKLDAVSDRLGIGRKREHEGFGLWLKCEAGDESAWNRMRAYNRQDVILTERLFEDFRAWIPLRGVSSQKRLRELVS